MLWSIPFVLIIVFLFITNSKINYLKLRNNSKKINAKVVEYRKEKGPMRNDYTLLNYPYVRIDLEDGSYILQKLSYADNYSQPFQIGEEIPVFWNNEHLLYWNTYDKGFFKYFPENWSLKK